MKQKYIHAKEKLVVFNSWVAKIKTKLEEMRKDPMNANVLDASVDMCTVSDESMENESEE